MSRNCFLHPRLYDYDFLLSKQRRDDLQYLIEKYISPKGQENLVVLDFGGGTAPYKSMFDRPGIKYKNADITESADIRIGPDGRLDIQDNSIDIVLSLQVLEHIEDVQKYLIEAGRVLKPGGVLWLTTHGIWHFHPSPIDYHRWTLAGLYWQVARQFDVEEDDAFLGVLAYAPFSYLKLFWMASRTLNGVQSKYLNMISNEKRWGKGGSKNRIKSPWLYLGNILLVPAALLLNPLIVVLEWLTPLNVKRMDAAVFRLACRKRFDLSGANSMGE